MNKFVLLGLFATLALSSAAVAQTTAATGVLATGPGVDPVEEAVKNSEYVRLVLGAASVKAALPPHLQTQGQKVLVDADKQLNACEKDLRTTKLVWVYKVCTSAVMKVSLNAFKQLEAQAAVSTTTARPGAGAGGRLAL